MRRRINFPRPYGRGIDDYRLSSALLRRDSYIPRPRWSGYSRLGEYKPKLELSFEDTQPPFDVEAEAEISIRFNVGLAKGDVARKAVIFFFVPPGFAFLGSPRGPRPSGKYANYVTTEIDLGDMAKGINRLRGVKLKAPSETNHFTAAYKLMCEGYVGNPQKFEIVVKEADMPF